MTTVASTARASAGGVDRERGQALAELALVTPILVLLIMAVVQFAFVLETQMGLTNAVREAARRAAADPSPTEAGVRAQLDALLAANIQGYDAGRLWTAADGAQYRASPAVTFSCYSILGVESSPGVPLNNYRVTIYVAYKNPVFFPLLSYATDLVDRKSNGTWDLTAEASMRIETDAAPSESGPCPP
jgi:Flp pilus assembly protein TadG